MCVFMCILYVELNWEKKTATGMPDAKDWAYIYYASCRMIQWLCT